jgi:hypothetical protein
LILALRKIGDAEAVPRLGHMAEFEPNADVRREAEWTLRGWAAEDGKGGANGASGASGASGVSGGGKPSPERAARARQALRRLEEAHGVEDAG